MVSIKLGDDQSHRNRDPVKPLLDFVDRLANATSEEEQQQIVDDTFELAQEIWALVELKRHNGGTLPRGTCPQAAHRRGLSEDQVDRLVKEMERLEQERRAGKHNNPRVSAVGCTRGGIKATCMRGRDEQCTFAGWICMRNAHAAA